MSHVLDASALLALIFAEPGADTVSRVARNSWLLSVIAIDGNPDRAEMAVDRLEIAVIPFDRQLARLTAELRQRTAFMGASFADRACLALGLQSGRIILSSDRDWSKLDLGITIQIIR
jgi:ribonuclease VapC